jgi:hypothetical protein
MVRPRARVEPMPAVRPLQDLIVARLLFEDRQANRENRMRAMACLVSQDHAVTDAHGLQASPPSVSLSLSPNCRNDDQNGRYQAHILSHDAGRTYREVGVQMTRHLFLRLNRDLVNALSRASITHNSALNFVDGHPHRSPRLSSELLLKFRRRFSKNAQSVLRYAGCHATDVQGDDGLQRKSIECAIHKFIPADNFFRFDL